MSFNKDTVSLLRSIERDNYRSKCATKAKKDQITREGGCAGSCRLYNRALRKNNN
ncbi:hypothetical protein GCM10022277_30420 [Litoribacillus peritrichatus]|uniref:Uncharacterized protein n=1 Tax=Litoribacillus peritrichatus TaxID=718191 RepID=A0ABP7MWC0_9GAMM